MQTDPPAKRFNARLTIIAGELSGEVHASRLISSLKAALPLDVTAMGSDRLANAGARIICDYRSISVTGLGEIFSKLGRIRNTLGLVKKHLLDYRPDLLILVDYPGFNLRLAAFASAHGIPVVYFIPPQVWAWHKSRINAIKAHVGKVISILPFELDLYRNAGIDASYVGHPFATTVRPGHSREGFLEAAGLPPDRPVVALLPGSRDHEVCRHAPVMVEVVRRLRRRFGPLSALFALAESIPDETLRPLVGEDPIGVVRNLSHDALAYCDLALVASGSATLEAAILGAPTIVIYRVSALSYILGRLLVRVRYLSLPNIIAGRAVFPEFVQHLDAEKIAETALRMIKDGRDAFRNDLETIRRELGAFDSYDMARDAVVEFLRRTYGTLP